MHPSSALALILLGCCKLIASQSIDPSTVSNSDKKTWCNNQKTQCPLICTQLPGTNGGTDKNSCEESTLAYQCICDNGQSPNASEYSQTIPYFICTENNNRCVDNCGAGNSACQSSCREDHPCGAQDPKRVNTSTISTMMATATDATATASGDATATGTDGGVFTGYGGDSASTSTSTSSASSGDVPDGAQRLAIGFGRSYGLVLVLACIFGGFTIML